MRRKEVLCGLEEYKSGRLPAQTFLPEAKRDREQRLRPEPVSLHGQIQRESVRQKNCHPRPLFGLFSSFQTNITTNLCENMSIQYTVLGFEPTTFRT